MQISDQSRAPVLRAMYIPEHFGESDVGAMHDIIETYPFGQAFVVLDNGPEVTHAPVTLARDAGLHGTLSFHLARANPTSTVLTGEHEALWVFSGPHAYISPDWYEARDLVPTWNYVAVHARGTPVPVDDKMLEDQLETLAARNEAHLEKTPWSTCRLDEEQFAGLRRGIVGFEMPIASIEGKWKLNQNRTVADRKSVINVLRQLDSETTTTLANLMQASLKR